MALEGSAAHASQQGASAPAPGAPLGPATATSPESHTDAGTVEGAPGQRLRQLGLAWISGRHGVPQVLAALPRLRKVVGAREHAAAGSRAPPSEHEPRRGRGAPVAGGVRGPSRAGAAALQGRTLRPSRPAFPRGGGRERARRPPRSRHNGHGAVRPAPPPLARASLTFMFPAESPAHRGGGWGALGTATRTPDPATRRPPHTDVGRDTICLRLGRFC